MVAAAAAWMPQRPAAAGLCWQAAQRYTCDRAAAFISQLCVAATRAARFGSLVSPFQKPMASVWGRAAMCQRAPRISPPLPAAGVVCCWLHRPQERNNRRKKSNEGAGSPRRACSTSGPARPAGDSRTQQAALPPAEETQHSRRCALAGSARLPAVLGPARPRRGCARSSCCAAGWRRDRQPFPCEC